MKDDIAEVAAFRAEGLTFAEIGRRLGMSAGQARDRFGASERNQHLAAQRAQHPMPPDSVERLDINVRVAVALSRHNITTISEVRALTDEQMLSWHNFGKGSLRNLRDALARLEAAE